MKLLLDENLPKRLKQDLEEHEVYTVRDKGWAGFSNGDLLKLMLNDGVSVLLTFDKNLQHQQNFQKYPVTVIVLTATSNQYKYLKPLAPSILNALKNPSPGVTIVGTRVTQGLQTDPQ